jgi:ribonuclease HI
MAQKIYVDGSGDGRMTWYNEDTGDSWHGQKEGVTNNEAEYIAILNALESTKAIDVEILSDSKLVVSQLRREWHIKEDRLRELFDKVHGVIRNRGLNVTFVWISRKDNPAGKYLG